MKIETREVLAGAYKRGVRDTRLLTHAVEVDERGRELRVLCSRVKFDSLADRGSLTEFQRGFEPTCPACARAWRRYKS